jgi:membrane peptidoglycan carboxypeptidase
MIRVEQLRGWVESQAIRARDWAEVAAPRAQQAAGAIAAGLGKAVGAAQARARPLAATVQPQARRAGADVPAAMHGALGGVLPAAGRAMAGFRRQVEAGRDVRVTPKELRDDRGRRLRASAYAFGPAIHRARRRSRSGVPEMAGSFGPAMVKISLIVLIAVGGYLASSSTYINYAADLPDAHQIGSVALEEDSQIYASDGTLLADIHKQDSPQHYAESLDQMGKWLPTATIAIEDSGFWDEPGIDIFAMARAAWIDWRTKEAVQGASTITQQLVKLRLNGNSPTIDRKIREAVLAIQVEHTYTKRQILEQYLNAVDYSNNARGSLAGARVYFHKDSKDLDLAEAAMLAGIPQSPFFNNPFQHWDTARKRQLDVLNAMVRTRKITQEQADAAYAEDLSPPDHMFKPGTQVLAAPAFVSWVTSEVTKMYGAEATYGGGLQIHTTLNTKLQNEAEQAVYENIHNQGAHYGFCDGAMTAIDPRSGAVVAMVGSGPDKESCGGQYNLAVYPPRNPGSSIKIYDYTAAIASGKFTMATMIPDTPVTVQMPAGSPPWSPKNYDGKSHGTCQLQQCMGNSLNIPAVKVSMIVGISNVVDMARKMGAPPYYPLTVWDDQGQQHIVGYKQDGPAGDFNPSFALGGYGESPLQQATGAATLASQGIYHPPYGVASVQTSDGVQIYQADPDKVAVRVLDPKVAFIMEQIMSNDDNRAMIFGRNSPLTMPGRRIAAKTGTTDGWNDGWTLGYTPFLASAFWFGNAEARLMNQQADGVFVAAPAWHGFMAAALDTLQEPGSDWFAEPSGLGHATVGGEPVWLLPGTSANQPMPPLPPGTTAAAPKPSPSPSPGH